MLRVCHFCLSLFYYYYYYYFIFCISLCLECVLYLYVIRVGQRIPRFRTQPKTTGLTLNCHNLRWIHCESIFCYILEGQHLQETVFRSTQWHPILFKLIASDERSVVWLEADDRRGKGRYVLWTVSLYLFPQFSPTTHLYRWCSRRLSYIKYNFLVGVLSISALM